MQIDPKNNAITQRLQKVRQQWDSFARTRAEVMCWEVAEDERPLIEAFADVENSEDGVFPDFFIKFGAPFERADTYAAALAGEFKAFLADEAEALREEGIHYSFSFPRRIEGAGVLWEALSAFAAAIPGFTGRVVVYLAPAYVKSRRPWEGWLLESLEAPLPAGVCLLVTHGGELSGLAAAYPLRVHAATAALDMPGALRELAAAGNPKDPGVRFRTLFVELNQAAGRKDLAQVHKTGQKALHLVRGQAGWEHLEVAVLLAVASSLLGARQPGDALAHNERAVECARRAYEGKHPAGTALLIQALFFKGATLLAAKAYEAAALTYEAIVPYAREDGNGAFHQVEACRMAGFAHTKSGNPQGAWACNWSALEAAATLDAAVRQNSTLPYVGQALLELSGTLGYFEQEEVVRQRMVAYVGPDWEKKTAKNAVQL
jgi:hypothetical protein